MALAVEVIDASAIHRWATVACAMLESRAAEIDALNVYPVPDRDTGTNLHLTMRSALGALRRGAPQAGGQRAELGAALEHLTRGALIGARGNSGVIVSQLLRGLGTSLAQAHPADGRALATALGRAADLAYEAVAEPVEGTILTVARAAAEAAGHAVVGHVADADAGGAGAVDERPRGRRLEDVARAAASGALVALERTPSQLAVLAQAGVVDAGGQGLCVLLDAMVATFTGQDFVSAGRRRAASSEVGRTAPAALAEGCASERGYGNVGYGGFGYEVQFLLDATDRSRVDIIRRDLSVLGDSLVIADAGPMSATDQLWSVHVHVNDVGAAIEAGVRAGRPHAITVTRFADAATVPRPAQGQSPAGGGPAAAPWSGRALLALAPGAGLAGLFSGAGAQVLEAAAGGPPSVSEVLEAIHRTGAAELVVLTIDKNPQGHGLEGNGLEGNRLETVADLAAERARAGGQDVAVVPTRSPVQCLAAVAVADPGRRFGDDVIAAAEAAAATRWAEVIVADADAMTTAGRCSAGDILGLAEGDVVLIGHDRLQVTSELLDRLLSAGGELVTLILDSDTGAGFAGAVGAALRRRHPEVEFVHYHGDQPDQPVLIGVE